MKVLVVDDDEVSSLLLADDLERLGYSVQLTPNGEEGWEAFQAGTYPIVILDWEMPGMSGPDLCRLIRSRPAEGYTYLIILTGRSQREDRFNALDSGADDFLTKPVDSAELHARLAVANRILKNEESLHSLNRQIQAARQQEGELASSIQKELLLGTPPTILEHLWMSSMCLPSSMVAGDFYDFYPHQGGFTDIVTGDVMGKGVPAALVAAGVKSSLEKSLLTCLGKEGSLPDIPVILDLVCEEVVPRLSELATFSTLTYARVDERTGVLSYVNCGNPEILRWDAAADRCELLPTSTVPVGFLASDEYTETRIELGPGDLVLFYSDGVSDLIRGDGTPLGSDGLATWIQPRAYLPLPDLLEELSQLRNSANAKDDFTCVALRFVGKATDEGTMEFWTESKVMATARDAIKAIALRHQQLDGGQIDELILAFQEAATNAMRHARPTHRAVPLKVSVEQDGSELRVELRYPGITFDPRVNVPGVAELSVDAIGGFGLTIMDQCTDRMEYGYENGMNRLTLIKGAIGV